MWGRFGFGVFLLLLLPLVAIAQKHVSKSSLRKAPSVQQNRRAQGPAHRFDAWQVLGPGGGGTMVSPTISPHDPSGVLEHCDMTGGYITTERGSTGRTIAPHSGIPNS